MTKVISILKVAIKNISSNKLRTVLTMLGLIIGITSVILLVGIGTGATSNVRGSVKSLGTGTLTVSINSSSSETLEYSQLDEILELSNVQSVAPYKNVSVTERTKEIGIRKALGAKRKDILTQFLSESLILCIMGGIVGIILGLGLGMFLQIFGLTFTANSLIIIISFASSAIIGLIFGIFPAYKASKLNPIDALRTE